MARIRSIKPDFWTDEKIVELSPLARLLFIGMWNFVDDYGRSEYSPKRLKMQILPSDNADMPKLIGEIRGKKLIDVYEVDNKQYFTVCNFVKHQKVDKRRPSKIPAPSKCAELPQKTPPEVEVNKYLEVEGIKDLTTSVSHEKIVFDRSNGKFSEIPQNLLGRWKEAYPAVDIPTEAAKAEAWLLANPKNKKSNYNRFLTNWLSRAQDKAPRAGNGSTGVSDLEYEFIEFTDIKAYRKAKAEGKPRIGLSSALKRLYPGE